MTLSGNEFVSAPIKVTLTNTTGKYKVTFDSAPDGTYVKNEKGKKVDTFNDGESFIVVTPSSNNKGTIKVRITATGLTTKVYEYTTGSSYYQRLIPVTLYKVETGEVSTTVKLTFEKEVTKLSISKQDIASSAEVPGATLIIKDSTGKEVARWVSTTEPHYIEGLAEGSYTLTETIAPKGYKLSSETISFRLLANGEIQSVVMYNEREITRVRISKQDITTKEEVAGATLIIRDASGKEVARWVSETTPHYIEGLAAGDYTLTEEIAPSGYKLSSETVKFTLKADGSVQNVVMYNEKEVTKVKISKQDITSKEEVAGASLVIRDANGKVVDSFVSGTTPHYIEGLAEGSYTLTETIAPSGYKLSSETVKFTLKADGSVQSVVMYNEKEVTKVKISKQDIANGEEVPGATLIIRDASGKEVARWVSGTTPHYIEGLPEGNYTLTEEIAPEGYELSSETIKFTLKADGSIQSTIMYNARKTEITKVKISKQDITSGEEVAGATLIIKDSEGKEVARWVSETTPHYIEGLPAGDYTLTEEIAPEGYRLSSETVNFTIKEDGSITSVVMYNTRKVVKLSVSKQDITTKEELAGATLVIRDLDGKVVERWISMDTPHYTENLSEGTYTLVEEKAPNGYKLASKAIEFTLKDSDKVTQVVIYNEKKEPTKVRISKQDITNKTELPGATLIIRDNAGIEVDRWVSGTTPHYIEGLSVGKYTLTEIIAPNGYVLSSETINFTVTDDGEVVDVVMYNQPKIITKVVISKQDITTKKELPGATLVIRDANGNIVDQWISGTNAHYIEGLEEGIYTLTEIQAPDGYALSTETIEFTVKGDGSITNVVMYNEKLITVPITDLDINSATVVLGSVITFMGAGILVFYKKRYI